MTDEHLSEDSAIELAMGDAPSAVQAAHLAGCPACAARIDTLRGIVEEGQAALAPLARTPSLDAQARSRSFARLEKSLEPTPRWPIGLVTVGLAGSAAVLGARAAASSEAGDLALPALTLLLSLTAALASTSRWAREVAFATVGVSLALGLLDAHDAGDLHADLGARCLVIELGLGSSAAALIHWSGAARRRPDVLAASAGAGALAAQAALMLACHAPGALLHGLVFHTLGVVLAVALAQSTRYTLYSSAT